MKVVKDIKTKIKNRIKERKEYKRIQHRLDPSLEEWEDVKIVISTATLTFIVFSIVYFLCFKS